MSFFTQGLPGVAESTFQKAKKNLHPWKKVPGRVDEGGLLFIASPHPPSSTVPPLPEGEGKTGQAGQIPQGQVPFPGGRGEKLWYFEDNSLPRLRVFVNLLFANQLIVLI